MPCSCAFFAASSAASCAANGVDLREPLKPRTPADDHATTFPETSVIVTMVLLNVDWMLAMPLWTFFLTFFFVFGLDMFRYSLTRTAGAAARRAARRLLAQHALARPLAGARVGVRPLAAHRQASPVAQAAVAAEVHEALDVHRDLAAQVAFDLVLRLEDVAD